MEAPPPPRSEAAFLSWEGILLASVMTLRPQQQYEGWPLALEDVAMRGTFALKVGGREFESPPPTLKS